MTPPQEPERDPQVPGHELSGPWRPTTIDYAFWSGIASVVVGFAMLAASFLLVSDSELQAVLEETAAQGQPITMDQARSIYNAVLVMVVVIVVAIAALWIMFLFFMRRGRNWARIVITVIGAVWILLTIPSVAGGGIAASLLSLLQLLAVAATIVFAYLAPSNQYFQHGRHR
ncbi:hypothetical protein [Saccharopolyspora elongata]|uniref:hypothetical protein n=1 Tax=Saccharopolyspora elongata TaxID=2530387 RepID=UPI001F378BD2|nr:hypothetical protein [Saccharopolyspora elongata]